MSHRIKRRDFLKKSALAGAVATAPMFVPASALGRAGSLPPSERIVLGFVGVHNMGSGHIGHFLREPRVHIAAIADVDRNVRDEKCAWVGAHCAGYNDYRDLLARKDIDAVVIATPDHWHAMIAIHACEAGKDVYCEKPLSLTIHEGRKMVEAARRYGRVFQTGSQQRSDSRFRHACMLVRNGRIGKLKKITTHIGGGPSIGAQPVMPVPKNFDYDTWLGPAPWEPYTEKRCHYQFRWNFDYSGGKMTDWGAHHNDIAQWGNGTDGTGPIEVGGWGRQPSGGLYNTFVDFDFTYKYANGVELNCVAGGRNGVDFDGTDGWVKVSRGWIEASDPDLLTETFGSSDVHLYNSPEHHTNWLNCIETRDRPITDVEIGHRSVTVCHIGVIAGRLGRKLRWNPEKEEFIGDDEANTWLERPYRAPWHL